MPEPLTQVRQISHIAYGFMASRTMFAALNIGLFAHISSGVRTLDALCAVTGVAEHRLKTLMAVLVSLGLVVREEDRFTNAPATERYLVPGAPAYFGDYYRFQRTIPPAGRSARRRPTMARNSAWSSSPRSMRPPRRSCRPR